MGHATSTSNAAVDVAQASFRREADMLSPLQEYATVVVPGDVDSSDDVDWRVLFEVPTVNGVVDVLYAAFDEQAVNYRRQAGLAPIIQWHELLVFAALQLSARRPIILADLALRVGMTPTGLRRGALSRLAASGHIELVDGDSVISKWSYRLPTRALIAVEAKRLDWRRAVSQARRYTSFADRTFIAIEPTAAVRAQKQRKIIESSGIGILSVDPGTRQVHRLMQAPIHSPATLHRMFAAEQSLEVAWDGRVSGPVLPVFGRSLTTSEGVDPRL